VSVSSVISGPFLRRWRPRRVRCHISDDADLVWIQATLLLHPLYDRFADRRDLHPPVLRNYVGETDETSTRSWTCVEFVPIDDSP